MAGVRRGDLSVFEEIFHQHWANLCDFAYTYLGARDLAEEVVQDVFFRLWAQHGAWQIRGDLKPYLCGAVRNGALSTLRRLRLEAKWAGEVAREARLRHDEQDPDAQATDQRAKLDATVARVIARQPERRRAVVQLRWVQRLSYAAIAEALGISVRTVENHLARALKDLRKEFELTDVK